MECCDQFSFAGSSQILPDMAFANVALKFGSFANVAAICSIITFCSSTDPISSLANSAVVAGQEEFMDTEEEIDLPTWLIRPEPSLCQGGLWLCSPSYVATMIDRSLTLLCTYTIKHQYSNFVIFLPTIIVHVDLLHTFFLTEHEGAKEHLK